MQTPEAGRDSTTIQGYSPKQIWKYDQAKTTVKLGQPEAEIVFMDQYASNDWTLERGASDGELTQTRVTVAVGARFGG